MSIGIAGPGFSLDRAKRSADLICTKAGGTVRNIRIHKK
jgi:hypothetical protein